MPLMNKDQIAEIKDLHAKCIQICPLYSSEYEPNEGSHKLADMGPDTKHFLLYYATGNRDFNDCLNFLKYDNAFKAVLSHFFDKSPLVSEQIDKESRFAELAKLCDMQTLHQYKEELPEDLQERYGHDELKEAVATFYYLIINSYAKLIDNEDEECAQAVYAEKMNNRFSCAGNHYYQMEIYPKTVAYTLKEGIKKKMDELKDKAKEVTGKYSDGQDVYDRVQKQHSDTEKEMDATELTDATQETEIGPGEKTQITL